MAAPRKYSDAQRLINARHGGGLPRLCVRLEPELRAGVDAAGGGPWVRRLVAAALALREPPTLSQGFSEHALIEAALSTMKGSKQC